MKNIKFGVFALLLVVVPFLFFSACNQKDQLNNPQGDDFASAAFAVIDGFTVENAIEDASVDTEMSFNENFFSYSFLSAAGNFGPGNKMMMGNGWFDRFDFSKHLGLLLRKLKLTDEQKAQAKELAKAFHEEMKPLVKSFREANMPIVKAANEKRKDILEKAKLGTITREQAKTEIKALNEKTKEAIKTNPATVEVQTKMCNARKGYFTKLEAILIGEQKTEWKKAVEKLKFSC